MNHKLQSAVKAALAGTVLAAASTSVMAAGAVASSYRDFDGGPGANHIPPGGGSLVSTGQTTTKNSFAGNPLLGNSAWGHQGRWYTFHTHTDLNTTLRVDAVTNDWSPAVTLWSSNLEWDLGNSAIDGGVSGTGTANPHDFNAVGNIGDAGTNWMSGVTGSNITNTLGYANAGVGYGIADWGEDIQAGAHALEGVTVAGLADGITSGLGANHARITFLGLDPGWYTVFVGGADNSSTASGFNAEYALTVSQVPVPAAVWLFGSGLLGLISMGRKKRAAA